MDLRFDNFVVFENGFSDTANIQAAFARIEATAYGQEMLKKIIDSGVQEVIIRKKQNPITAHRDTTYIKKVGTTATERTLLVSEIYAQEAIAVFMEDTFKAYYTDENLRLAYLPPQLANDSEVPRLPGFDAPLFYNKLGIFRVRVKIHY